MSDYRKLNEGFSLVELLVAIAIMVILAGGTAVAVIKWVDKARVARAKSDIAMLEAALKTYRLDNYSVPTQRQGLRALVDKPLSAPVPKNWQDGGYLEKESGLFDPWGNEYVYYVPSRDKKKAYEIVTLGADGQPGGEGFDADISSIEL